MPQCDPKKLFTVSEANAALPLVRAIVGDLAALSRDVAERRERMAHLLAGRDEVEADDLYSEELVQIEQELDKDAERLAGFVQELRELGVEPKNPAEGLVDFPSMMDGRVVYLCWKLGEAEVLYWHEIDTGFSGRQSLTAESLSDEGGAELGDSFDS